MEIQRKAKYPEFFQRLSGLFIGIGIGAICVKTLLPESLHYLFGAGAMAIAAILMFLAYFSKSK